MHVVLQNLKFNTSFLEMMEYIRLSYFKTLEIQEIYNVFSPHLITVVFKKIFIQDLSICYKKYKNKNCYVQNAINI